MDFNGKNCVWDNSVPVEKSAYINTGKVKYVNAQNFLGHFNKPTMIDLFCGAGGFSLGTSWLGFCPLFGIDYFAPAMDTWICNHPHSIGCIGDIRKADPYYVKDLLRSKGVTSIDLITGGVPCQGFSRANRKHNDNDERNFLFLEYMRFVKAFVPNYIILENVSGMRSTAGGHFERQIIANMTELGYTVTVSLINAADYGVPQIRQRLIFVGVKNLDNGTKPYRFPVGAFRDCYRTVADAISDLPALKNNQTATEYCLPPQNDYQRLMRGDGKLPIAPATKLYNHSAPNHLQSVLKKIAATPPGKPMYEKFKQRIRLNNDAPSPTQLAGGIRPQFQFGHPTQIRGLSIRERARIQSFPDSYVFKGGMVQERVQTGNAIPPLMVYNIVKPIAEALKKARQANV